MMMLKRNILVDENVLFYTKQNETGSKTRSWFQNIDVYATRPGTNCRTGDLGPILKRS